MTVQPGITEQLAGIRTILEREIAPRVDDPYTTVLLETVVQVLGRVELVWAAQLPGWVRENEELVALFGDLAPAAGEIDPADLGEEVVRAGALAVPRAADLPDPQQVEVLNNELRALLSRLIAALATASASPTRDDARERIRRQLRRSLDRIGNND